jgi:hypothetical protein
MKLSPQQWHDLYCALMLVLYPDNEGVKEMLARADKPEIRENPGPLSGLKQTINDQFSMHMPFVGRERELLEAELKRRGLPPLNVIEASRTKKYRGIIKRGKIANEEEFYIVQGLLDDQASLLEDAELQALGKIMTEHLRKYQ